MASVIKSLALAEMPFALGGTPSVKRQAAVPPAQALAKSDTQEGTSWGAKSAKANTVQTDKAIDIEAIVAKRIDEALARHAAEIKDRVDAEAQAVLAEAAERGYEEGLQRAAREIETQKQAIDERLGRLQQSLQTQIADGFADVEDLACDIAFEAVLKILGQEIASGNAIAAVVRDATYRIGESDAVVLRLHPEDAALMKSNEADAKTSVRYRIEADEAITRGGCLVETSHGILDARLETRLTTFVDALRGRPSEHPEAMQ